jgi:hypothetical protein
VDVDVPRQPWMDKMHVMEVHMRSGLGQNLRCHGSTSQKARVGIGRRRSYSTGGLLKVKRRKR